MKSRLLFVFLVLVAAVWLAGVSFISPTALAFDWQGNALAGIRQMEDLLQQAKSYNLVQVRNYWSELRPSISGAVPWIDPFLGSDSSDMSGYQEKFEMAKTLYDRGEYVAIFKVLRLNILNNQLAGALVQRKAAVAKIKRAISDALVPPADLPGPLAALQKKYWDKLGAVINPIYLPELTPSRIKFLEHRGLKFFYVELTENVAFSASGSNQNSRIAGNFNVVITDLLMGDLPLGQDFSGYVFETTYSRSGPKSQPGALVPETIDYVLFNKDIQAWRDLKITSQELIDRSIVMNSGKRLKVVLELGDE